MAEQPRESMEQAIDHFDRTLRQRDRLASSLGATAAIVTPTLIIKIVGAITGLSGGAAIMKSLKLAGSLVGEGAMMGVPIMGIGAVMVGWAVTEAVGAWRANRPG